MQIMILFGFFFFISALSAVVWFDVTFLRFEEIHFIFVYYSYLCVPVPSCTYLSTLIDDHGLHYLHIATVIADCFTVKDYKIILG